MHTYKIIYSNGTEKTVKAKTTLEVVKKYDLATKENIGTRLVQID